MPSMTHRNLALAAGLSAALLLAGGCVSQAKYDEAVAANKRMKDNLAACRDELQGLQGRNDQLQGEMSRQDAELARSREIIETLTAGRDDLQAALRDLQARYDELLAQPAPPPPVVALPEQVDAALKQLASEHPGLMEYLPKYGMLKIKSDLTFGKGSTAVKSEAADALRKLASVMQGGEAARFNVYIAGHTDDIPIRRPETRQKYGSNWGLSAYRAISVIDVLEEAGLAPERLGALGFSKYHPVAPNAPGNKGNVLNRRVEIWIVPPDRFLTGASEAAPGPEAPLK
jgi:chemotaxis protein MotB